jgi:F-type H+-transporting ATPase subunit beta
VPLSETIDAFNAIADGKYDSVPEQAFFMCGGIDDLERNAAELAKK